MYAFAGPVEQMAKAMHAHQATRGSRNGSRNKNSTSTTTNVNCSSVSSCSPLSRVCTSALRVNSSPLQQQPSQNQSLFHRIRSATTSTTLNWWSTLTSVVQVPSTSLLPFPWPFRLNTTLTASSTTPTAPTALPDTLPPSPLPLTSNQAGCDGQGSSSGVCDCGSNGLDPQPPSDQRQLLSSFLSPADVDEIRYACLLSDLSNAAYDISSDALSSVLQRHQLSLVSTSASCSFGPVCLADWEAEVDHGMAWAGNHAEGVPGSPHEGPQTNLPATDVGIDQRRAAQVTQPEQHVSEQGQQLRHKEKQHVSGHQWGHTSETASGLAILGGSEYERGLIQGSLLEPPMLEDSRSYSCNASANTGSPADTRRPTSPTPFPSTPEISCTPQPLSSPFDSPPLSRSHSSSTLVADTPPPARLSPAVTLVSLSDVEETVGMAMAWPKTFHYPLLTQMPRALAPTPTRRGSADGIAASFADPASASMHRLPDEDANNTTTKPQTAPTARHASSDGASAISEGARKASSKGGSEPSNGTHTRGEGAEEEWSRGHRASSEGGSEPSNGTHSRGEGLLQSVCGLPLTNGDFHSGSAAVEEEEEDLQLRLWAERQRAASVAIGGSGMAAARFRDEPEAPGTPPLQVEHTFRQRYSPPDVQLPHPPLSAPALVDGIEVTELGLTCGPEAEPAQCSSEPLCDWFVCDDEATNIRYFAIQGSITLQHWQINLQFDPVVFEDPTYGVRVHRGVYETALKLYNDLAPLVRQHLASPQPPSQPSPRIAFTGHSLGGSLSTLLTLLLLHRGVAHPQQVAHAYAFGAPAVFCGGEDESAFLQQPQQQHNMQQQQQQQQQQCREEGNEKAIRVQEQAPAPAAPAVSASAPAVDASAPAVDASVPAVHASAHASMPAQDVDAEAIRNARSSLGLLQRLGLTDRHFVNIIMHRDIVPRAFGCDYALVADLLKQWLPSFKTHPPLQGAYKSLYNFLGSVAVLKPHESSPFVQPADAGHPLLPELPGLFHLRAPSATRTSKQHATKTSKQCGEEYGPQASPAAQSSSTPAATLPATSSPCNSHATPEITANHTAVQHVSMPAAAALPSTLSSHTSHAVPEGTASHAAALHGQVPAVSATPPETLPPSVSSSSVLKAATTTGLGERSTLPVHGSISFKGAGSQTGTAACEGADTQIDLAVCKGANTQIGPSAANEQLKHAHIHLVGASSPRNQQGVSGTGSEGFECANNFDELEASINGNDLSPSTLHLSPFPLPHRSPQASQTNPPKSTAPAAAHHTPILTFPPTSASTAHAAAAAVAAAVHAHPAEANMGPGSLQDQAAVAAAAVAAAAAATAFSGDNLAPCSHPGHLRPTTGKSSSSSLLYTSESRRPSHRGSSSDNLALRHPGHHWPTIGKSSSSSPLYTSESRRPPHPERSTFNLALRHNGHRGPTIGAPSSSPSHTNASPHLHDASSSPHLHINASSSPHLHTSEPRRPSHHGSGGEPKVWVPQQQPSIQQQQQQQQQQHTLVPLQQSTQQQQQHQQQQPNDMPHSNNILAAGRVRKPLVLRDHQRDSCTVVLGVSASGAQRRDNSGANSGSIAALQVPSACAAAAAGSSGGGVGHSSSLSSSRGSLEGSGIGADGNTASQGPEDSFSYGSVGSEHGGETVGSQGRQNQWESSGDERGGRPPPAHRQLSPAVTTLQEATQLFLNTPHPLATLSEYASYGSDGAISRYHNPDNYTKGLIILADLACQSS